MFEGLVVKPRATVPGRRIILIKFQPQAHSIKIHSYLIKEHYQSPHHNHGSNESDIESSEFRKFE